MLSFGKLLNGTVILLVFGLASLLFIVTGCTSLQPAPKTPRSACLISGQSAPEWACGQGAIFNDPSVGVGSSPATKGGFDFDRKTAQLSALSSIIAKHGLDTEISTEIEIDESSQFADDNEAVKRNARSITKTRTESKLKNFKQKDIWIAEDGTIYVLIRYGN